MKQSEKIEELYRLIDQLTLENMMQAAELNVLRKVLFGILSDLLPEDRVAQVRERFAQMLDGNCSQALSEMDKLDTFVVPAMIQKKRFDLFEWLGHFREGRVD